MIGSHKHLVARSRSVTAALVNQPNRQFFGKREGRLVSGVQNYGCFVFVGEEYAALIHRFEKYNRQMEPGLNFKVPIIDKLAYVHDLREQVIEISQQVAVTKDNVSLHIDGVLYIEIFDPMKASYGVDDYVSAITNLAQTTMRSEIGKLRLDDTFEERETLNKNIVNAIELEAREWGISALRYEIKDIEPPNAIQNAMIKQAQSERQKRANILKSEGEKLAAINIAESEKISQQLKAEGAAESTIIQAKAQADALASIDEQLQKKSGYHAAQFLLGQRYIESYKSAGKGDTTLILESNPVDVSDQIKKATSTLKN